MGPDKIEIELKCQGNRVGLGWIVGSRSTGYIGRMDIGGLKPLTARGNTVDDVSRDLEIQARQMDHGTIDVNDIEVGASSHT